MDGAGAHAHQDGRRDDLWEALRGEPQRVTCAHLQEARLLADDPETLAEDGLWSTVLRAVLLDPLERVRHHADERDRRVGRRDREVLRRIPDVNPVQPEVDGEPGRVPPSNELGCADVHARRDHLGGRGARDGVAGIAARRESEREHEHREQIVNERTHRRTPGKEVGKEYCASNLLYYTPKVLKSQGLILLHFQAVYSTSAPLFYQAKGLPLYIFRSLGGSPSPS